MKIACYFLFSTVLNKLFHITDVYIRDMQQRSSTRVRPWQQWSIMKTVNREKKLIIILIGYSSTLGGTLSSDCLAGHSVRSKV